VLCCRQSIYCTLSATHHSSYGYITIAIACALVLLLLLLLLLLLQ